jgi:hypothetical protein
MFMLGASCEFVQVSIGAVNARTYKGLQHSEDACYNELAQVGG